MVIIIACILFLLMVSYMDIRKREVSNTNLSIFLFLGIWIIIFSTGNTLILFLVCLFTFLLCYVLWRFNVIAGADAKILSILPAFFELKGLGQIFTGIWFFWICLIVWTLMYAVALRANKDKQKHVPFIPIITLSYISFLIFRYFLIQ